MHHLRAWQNQKEAPQRERRALTPNASPVRGWRPASSLRSEVRPEPPLPAGGPVHLPRKPRALASVYAPQVRHENHGPGHEQRATAPEPRSCIRDTREVAVVVAVEQEPDL